MKKIALALIVVFCVSSMAFAWPWSKKGSEEAKGKTTGTKMTQKKTTKKGTMTVKKTVTKKKVVKKAKTTTK